MPAGCGSSEKPPTIAREPYSGPPISLDTSGSQAVVVFQAPSGGWAAQVDRTARELERTEVFITARRPNPAFQQSQALVEHRLATGVLSSTAVAVYLRVLRHDEQPGDQPYSAYRWK